MTFHVLTLFPEMIRQGLDTSILGRAMDAGILKLNTVNIRDFSTDNHKHVDDYPYGGGAGMVMQAPPIYDAWRSVAETLPEKKTRVVYLTPQGRPFTQQMAIELAAEEDLILLCGHYEGVDERVLEEIVTDPVSIGDYVLTGGELAAMVVIDAVSRMVPGVLTNEESGSDESFMNGLLEYPQYTRPEVFHGRPVPEVLRSGHHARISEWRRQQSLLRTRAMRPELLLKEGVLTPKDRRFLQSLDENISKNE